MIIDTALLAPAAQGTKVIKDGYNYIYYCWSLDEEKTKCNEHE